MHTDSRDPGITDHRPRTRPLVRERVTGINRDERYFEALFENALDAFVVLSETGRFMDANPAACQLIGLERNELIGRDVTETIETGTDFDSAWGKFGREGKYRGQRWLMRPDGARRLIEIMATANVLPGRHLAVWRDVTFRYFLESELVQKEKDEALARLAGGIAHNLTNLLNVVGGHTELMIDQRMPNSENQRHIDSILVATKQAAALTSQLSALGRQQVLSPAVLDLDAFVHSCRGALRSIVPENVDLVLLETKQSAAICVDRTQMAQIVFTLTSTAGELVPNGGRLTIAVKGVALKQPLARPGFRIPAGEYIVLELQARPQELLRPEKVLPQALFSADMRGVGPALPAVTATVKQNHGFLWVEGHPARGTILSVYFPPMIGHALASPKQESCGGLGGSETVLLVEDDPGLRGAMREYLTCVGYRVLQAGNGEEALRTAQSVERIDVLIADLRMPKMGGQELAERISTTLPRLKVMFISGNVDRAFIHRQPGEGQPTLLPKPFEMRALASTLRDLLDGRIRKSPHSLLNRQIKRAARGLTAGPFLSVFRFHFRQ
jgi:PAS domain S-box-containing protein